MRGNNSYLDTNALFKRYVSEKGSQTVNKLFQQGAAIFISGITLCEVIANLSRLLDIDKIINEDEFENLKATFLGDIGDEVIDVIELTPSIILQSLEICSKQYVTPLDALQLASALSLLEKPIFVCSDQKLLRLTGEQGLPTLDPLSFEEQN